MLSLPWYRDPSCAVCFFIRLSSEDADINQHFVCDVTPIDLALPTSGGQVLGAG